MSFVEVKRIDKFTVADLVETYPRIELNPDYQRNGDVWSLDRQQLLIDSIIRGYDIPKLYFRKHAPMVEVQGRAIRYSVIDGQQRIRAIMDFMNDRYGVDTATDLTSDVDGKSLAGRKFSELYDFDSAIARKIQNFQLDVVAIETDDSEVIEDMFLRLNEAAPLNAAEKRNAFGGPIPVASRQLAELPFFKDNLKYSNARYRHYDMATKFIYFEYRRGVADTKKVYLDRFVRNAAEWVSDPSALTSKVSVVLEAMHDVFLREDTLLNSVGMASVYYLVFREAVEQDWLTEITRERLVQFESKRIENRTSAKANEDGGEFELNEFDRLSQSPNDAVALRFRRDVLLKHFNHALELSGEDND
ncbi:DUF262 domain-containing protein [Pseudarthrobacter sp. NKDBFgelt]|uniref:DUF262 domain-containing protein n=1 Tax=Pseudarthrobacter sp. NKDBFgelt TaxID=3384443 RepID=UPI0038D435F7